MSEIVEPLPGNRDSSWPTMVGIVLLAGAGLIFLTVFSPNFRHANGDKHSVVGRALPQLVLQPLTGDSRAVELADLKGRVALINFWGTWCPPCREEFPEIVALAKRYESPEKFQLLAVSCGAQGDGDIELLRESTDRFMRSKNYDLPTYADQHAYTRTGLAMIAGDDSFIYHSTILLDRQGIIRGFWQGYQSSANAEMQEAVDKLLGEK
jgi:thiol-disulfide isomerase/thioredoxin